MNFRGPFENRKMNETIFIRMGFGKDWGQNARMETSADMRLERRSA